MNLKLPNINSKFFKDNMLAIVLTVFLVYLMFIKKNPLKAMQEGFAQILEPAQNDQDKKAIAGPGPSENTQGPAPVLSMVKANEEEMEYGLVGAPFQEINLPACSQFISSNLLPKDDPKLDQNFTEFSPVKDLQGQSFIDTNKYAIGMQSQTLRNANHQLRSDPPIANTMACASPWNNTTIDQEARRPLNIGSE